MRTTIGTLLICCGLAVANLAIAGEVTGRLSLPEAPEPVRKATADLYGKYQAEPVTSIAPAVGVVALLSPKGPIPLEPGKTPVVDQKGLAFRPQVLAVQTGQAVDFLNSDPVFHNIFSLSPVKRFDLGRYAKGRSKAVTFDRAGIVQYFCDIHPEMNGVIVVVETPYFTVTDPGGAYRITDVPPGTYEVAVWTSSGSNKMQVLGKVTVPETGSVPFTADLDR